MPSSKKTPNLLLNKWLGGDKPKKDDFNEDNEILDQNFGAMNTRIGQVESKAEELLEQAHGDFDGKLSTAKQEWDGKLIEVSNTWSGKLEAAQTQLEGKIGQANTALNTHSGNATVHVSAADRTAWNKGGSVTGTYQGNGAASRTISLGFTPTAGIVFAVEKPLVRSNWNAQVSEVHAAFFTAGGGSKGAAVTTNGIAVNNIMSDMEGYSYLLNQSQYNYCYIVWR